MHEEHIYLNWTSQNCSSEHSIKCSTKLTPKSQAEQKVMQQSTVPNYEMELF